MRILFASDIDGTLVNDGVTIAHEHARMLNGMCDKGLLFTVASARTPASALKVVKNAGIRLTAPAVCVNGALIWDPEGDRPLISHPISPELLPGLLALTDGCPITPRVYTVPSADGVMETLYRADLSIHPLAVEHMRSTETAKMPVRAVDSFAGREILALSYFGDGAILSELRGALERLKGIRTVFYASTYGDGQYFLECCDAAAGKGIGVTEAKRLCGADAAYVFGDNFNDEPMYLAADRAFAPANGEERMQRMAHEVIPSNNEGGVILKIKEIFGGAI